MNSLKTLLLSLVLILLAARPMRSAGAGFTYQGQLVDGRTPASGDYAMTFRLFNAVTNGVIVGKPIGFEAVSVTNGLFSVELDFGNEVFTGIPLWLEIALRDPAVDPEFTVLSPRQSLGRTPYAVRALFADSAARAGTVDTVSWAAVTGVPALLMSSAQRLSKIFTNVSPEGAGLVSRIGQSESLTWARETSTFSGWAQGIGVVKDFSMVEFFVRSWDPNHLITTVRCRIREGDSTGPILADATVQAPTLLGQEFRVAVPFREPIVNSAGKSLWIEYFTDGRTGQTVVNNPNNPPSQQYCTTSSIDQTTLIPTVQSVGFYVGFYSHSSGSIDESIVSDSFKEKLDVVPTKDTIHINLPKYLYALEGTEFSIYFANIIRANVSLDSLEIRVSGGAGALFDRFWRITPTAGDVGSLPMTVSVSYNNQVIASQSTTLVISPLNAASATPRQLLMIGDSTTANGIMAGELVRMYAADKYQSLVLRGTKGSAPVRFEAISGWRVDQFFGDPASPFVYSGVFDFNEYLKQHLVELGAGDWVTINLGINDVFGIASDADLSSAIGRISAQLRSMTTNILLAVPGIRVGICLTIPPPAGQDSFGYAYRSGQSWARYRRNNQLLVEQLLRDFDDQQVNGVFLVPINVNLDTVYNFTSQTLPVNARNPSITFTSASNGIHPAPPGYYQIADSLRAFLKAKQ